MPHSLTSKTNVFALSATFVLLILMLTSFYVAEKNGVFQVEKIELVMDAPNNLYWIDRKAELNEALQNVEKRNIWHFSISSLSDTVERSDWVATYKVFRTLPNKVSLEVVPKRVVGNLLQSKTTGGTTKVQPLTADGKLLQVAQLLRAPILPLVVATENDLKQVNLKALSGLLSSLPEGGAFSLNNIDEVTFDREGSPWLHVRKWNWDIRINGSKRDLKVSRVAEVAEYLKSQELTDRVIDAGFTQKVLVRPRKRR